MSENLRVRVESTGVQPAEQLLRRSLKLLLRSRALLTWHEGRRAEWMAWRHLIAALRSTPGYLAVSCAYCGQIRTSEGAWRRPVPTLAAYLRRHQALSHTYCPDCLEGHDLTGAPRLPECTQ